MISFGPSGGNRDENGYRFGVAAGVIGSSTVLPKSHLPFRKSPDTPLTWMVSPVWLGVTWLRPGVPAKASSQQTAFNAARHAFTTPKEGVGAGA